MYNNTFNAIMRKHKKMYNEDISNQGGVPTAPGLSPGIDNGQSQLITFSPAAPVNVDKSKSDESDILKDICNKLEEKIIQIKGKQPNKDIISQLQKLYDIIKNF